MKMIKLSEPYFFGNELHFLKKTLKDKWISANGKIVKDFENKLKKYTTGNYNLGIINCTSALQLAVRLLNPKKMKRLLFLQLHLLLRLIQLFITIVNLFFLIVTNLY